MSKVSDVWQKIMIRGVNMFDGVTKLGMQMDHIGRTSAETISIYLPFICNLMTHLVVLRKYEKP